MHVIFEVPDELATGVRLYLRAHPQRSLDAILIEGLENIVLGWAKVEESRRDPEHPDHDLSTALRRIVELTPGGRDALDESHKKSREDGYDALKRLGAIGG